MRGSSERKKNIYDRNRDSLVYRLPVVRFEVIVTIV